ncbi:hydroxymethylglutaryl-CoA reductase, degradative, partial [Bacillus haikouensis]|uniref:hydroxymethylglutaryl-CoA reductase, degradative n=1 Tax=Bacillus haikouensis TaxID=1510468 RepID=UPI0024843B27
MVEGKEGLKLTSEISKFYQRSMKKRQDILLERVEGLTSEEIHLYQNYGGLGEALTDQLIENSIGTLEIPLGLAVNFTVNKRDLFIPMATEESSVVAAASHAAKLARPSGGFKATTTGSIMFSQIQLVGIADLHGAKMKILENKEEILELARKQDPTLEQLGGGPIDLEVRVFGLQHPMLIVHLIVNTLDAMGANAVNTMAESIAPLLESLTGGNVLLKIISNLADKRLARSRCTVKKEDLNGEQVVDAIIMASTFASQDPYRAATHNKGIMNGISAVVLATGNDTRAVEAG